MDDLRSHGRMRLHVLVTRELIRRIASGAMAPGTLLPTEAELCHEFKVSRAVIRETMRVLVEKGLVDVRQGKGTFVAPMDRWDHLDPMILEERLRAGCVSTAVEEMLEVRRLVEVQMAGLAALRADPDDIQRLTDLVREMSRCLDDPERYSQLDNLFHETIGAASKNAMLARMTAPVYHLLRVGRRLTNRLVTDHGASQVGHHAIAAAIAQHDREAAQKAMADHIALFEHDIRHSLVEQLPKLSHDDFRVLQQS